MSKTNFSSAQILNQIIIGLFLLLLFATPLILVPWTSELFELPKMLFVYFITLLIASGWLAYLPLTGTLPFRRTPLDIPIILFLAIQILSTILSIHPYTSVWGWYTRLNGGLASTIAYIVLYHAFVTFATNPLDQENSKTQEQQLEESTDQKLKSPPDVLQLPNFSISKILTVSLLSGLLVSLYAIAEHFGIDAHLWVQDVRNRAFSTLGQPNWLAAYLAILLPLSYLPLLNYFRQLSPDNIKKKNYLLIAVYCLLPAILFLALVYTRSRSGFLAFIVSNLLIWILLFVSNRKLPQRGPFRKTPSKEPLRVNWKPLIRSFLILHFTFCILSLSSSTPFTPSISNFLKQNKLTTNNSQLSTTAGGTPSSQIRQPVWQGAIELGTRYPLLGTGPETFGYTYYWVRPASHNLNSEWEFLYNKAHNEYLNFLANTGFLGLGSYLILIASAIWLAIKNLLFKPQNPHQKLKNSKPKSEKTKGQLLALNNPQGLAIPLPDISATHYLIIAFLASYTTILITNFIGFSVVIIGLYFFLLPAFLIVATSSGTYHLLRLSPRQHTYLKLPLLVCILLLLINGNLFLYNYLKADLEYRTAEYLLDDQRYTESLRLINQAINRRPHEAIYHDVASEATADIAVLAYYNQQPELQAQFLDLALQQTQLTIQLSPYDLTLWKNRATHYLNLATIDPQYLHTAVQALERAHQLAPTEPKILYNLALLYAREANNPSLPDTNKQPSPAASNQKAIDTLQQAVQLKPDYIDAYYALALFYHDLAVNSQGRITNQGAQTQAVQYLNQILKINPAHPQALEKLDQWKAT